MKTPLSCCCSPWLSVRGFFLLMSMFGSLFFLVSVILPPVRLEMDGDVLEEQFRLCSPPSAVLSNASLSPLLYIVTPTYTRREQVAELIRLGQTLLHVPDIHWILSEDASTCSPLVAEILTHFGMPHTHLYSPMPPRFLHDKYKPRGVSNRRAALKWISNSHPHTRKAVVYFADDDNAYDLRLFPQIRSTEKVSMFPVGLIGSIGFSSPITNKGGQIVGFSDDWFAWRKFPVDMAGFAFSVDFLRSRGGGDMPYKPGHEEDRFLKSLDVQLSDIVCLAQGCTQILVWHTKTLSEKAPKLKPPRGISRDNSLSLLLKDLSMKNMVSLSPSPRAKNVPTCFKKTCATMH